VNSAIALSFIVLAGLAVFPASVAQALAVPVPPSCLTPNGEKLDAFDVLLRWNYSKPGVTQYHLQVLPWANDGPGVDLIKNASGGVEDLLSIPPPPSWYGLLPDMGYTWRLRASDAASGVGATDPSWSSWSSACEFRTPLVFSGGIEPIAPSLNSTNGPTNPTLQWRNSESAIFYYEVQLSKDKAFNTNPTTAIASVYWNLVHGGVTSPPNSYTVPADSPLEPGTRYYWRVRPRIQGDGVPIGWSQVWEFTTR